MLPEPDLLPDVLPTERLTANGMPVPFVRAELRRIPNLANAWTVVALWASTVGIFVGAIWINHPVAWVLAFLLMGPQFARFASLSHEAAHRLLFSNKRLNDFVGRWIVGYSTFVVDRPLPPRAHGAPQGRVRAERAGHEPLQRLSDHARVDAAQAHPRPLRQQRLEELQEPAARPAVRRQPRARGADPRVAGGDLGAVHARRAGRSSTCCCGSRRG